MRLYEDQPSGTVDRAKQLRRDAPEPERRLLRALREAFPELKWRHQAPVGPFYADILCFAQRLVIEVDDDTHAGAAERDATRTRIIEGEGFRVLRVTNGDVMENLEGVIEAIRNSLSHWEREGAAQRRKGEGDQQSSPNYPHPAALTRLAPLPAGRGEVKRSLLLAPLLTLAACATQISSAVSHAPETPGFLLGLWHGFIFPVAWVLSLFLPDVAVYAVPNNGGWYDFGFFLGIMVFGVGSHRGTKTVYVRTRGR